MLFFCSSLLNAQRINEYNVVWDNPSNEFWWQNTGWGQDGQVAAMLGLTELLPGMLKEKIDNTNPNHRFPAMWGPNYDWTPDQDHGSNLLMTIQHMIMNYSL